MSLDDRDYWREVPAYRALTGPRPKPLTADTHALRSLELPLWRCPDDLGAIPASELPEGADLRGLLRTTTPPETP